MRDRLLILTALAALPGLAAGACASGGAPARQPAVERAPAKPPAGPATIALVEAPLAFQDEREPFVTRKSFTFELPRPPRRARLLLRYTGVPGATSEDYTMGRFRHRVELNGTFLMDLNTHADDEAHLVEHTEWISPRLLRRHNRLTFIAGDDGARQGRPAHDEFTLRRAVLEFDW